jgi:hypothetical protein
MQDNKSNIDIVFRNGLKDYEALPPSSAWDNIAPALTAIRVRRTWVSVAASVTVLTLIASAGWLSGLLGTQNSEIAGLISDQDQNVSALQSITPVIALQRGISDNSGSSGFIVEGAPPSLSFRGRSIGKVATESVIPVLITTDAKEESLSDNNQNETKSDQLEPALTESIFPDPWTLPDKLSDTKGGKIDKWAMGAGFSPAMIIKQNSTGSPELDNMIENEKMMVSYTGGFSIAYSFNRRITINTGISYSSIAQRVTGLNTYSGFSPLIASKGNSDIVVATSAGKIVSSNPDIYVSDLMGSRVSTAFGADVFDPVKSDLPFAGTDLMQNFGYLEMPLFVRYKLVDRKLDINVLGGVSYSFLVTNSVHTSTFTGEKLYVGHTEGMSPFNISSSMGIGFEYHIPGNFSLSIEPIVRYYISPIGKQIGSSIHPWTAGVYTGFSYRF